MSNSCGTINVDNETLFWVGNKLATSTVEPTHLVKAPCGAFWVDGDKFAIVDGVITRVGVTEVTQPTVLCGMVELDAAVFAKEGNVYSLIPVPVEDDDDEDEEQEEGDGDEGDE